jgi:hypothetical protein
VSLLASELAVFFGLVDRLEVRGPQGAPLFAVASVIILGLCSAQKTQGQRDNR